MLIDAHCHLDKYLHKRFGGNIERILREIELYGILSLSNSMDISSHRINKQIAKKCKYVIPTFGIHPWNAHKYVGKKDLVKKLIRNSDFIGEIGLDFFFIKDKCQHDAQKKIFELFLEESEDKLISVHTKGAEKETFDLLRDYGKRKVIIHWYSGNLGPLKQMISERYYFTVGPELLVSPHIKKIAQAIPLDRILTETDNPGGPASFLGSNCSPKLVKQLIPALAKAKRQPLEELERKIEETFSKLIS